MGKIIQLNISIMEIYGIVALCIILLLFALIIVYMAARFILFHREQQVRTIPERTHSAVNSVD